jgi:hypothetical protein
LPGTGQNKTFNGSATLESSDRRKISLYNFLRNNFQIIYQKVAVNNFKREALNLVFNVNPSINLEKYCMTYTEFVISRWYQYSSRSVYVSSVYGQRLSRHLLQAILNKIVVWINVNKKNRIVNLVVLSFFKRRNLFCLGILYRIWILALICNYARWQLRIIWKKWWDAYSVQTLIKIEGHFFVVFSSTTIHYARQRYCRIAAKMRLKL